MDLTPHVAALRTGARGRRRRRRGRSRRGRPHGRGAGPALQLQLLDLLGEIALEVSAQLPDGRLDLQLAGRDPVLVYRGIDPAPPAASPTTRASRPPA